MIKEWESVIGLEVHLQLKTGTKAAKIGRASCRERV